jgi:hypothetical protein
MGKGGYFTNSKADAWDFKEKRYICKLKSRTHAETADVPQSEINF